MTSIRITVMLRLLSGTGSCTPDANGNLDVPGDTIVLHRATLPLYWKATAVDGQKIDSNVVDCSSCP